MQVEIKTKRILVKKNEGRTIEQKGLLGYGKASLDFHERALKKYYLLSRDLWTFSEISVRSEPCQR
jgi:hypothetical protein